ncbi:receptor-like protein kinase HSL1-like protein [Corchorus olitorius]|uniref:Receptor-like protein kinase HSL1-like protein n=1 Tax=Corchorus olitorius TaxID=93759 RepID=A0A1R3HW62_9ROSI|nr:receptor-like protein kinase HSL1-like protein [Corchorus olitorius]
MDRLPNLTTFRVFRDKLTGLLAPEFGLHSMLREFDVSENPPPMTARPPPMVETRADFAKERRHQA